MTIKLVKHGFTEQTCTAIPQMQLRQLPTNLKNGQAGQSKTNGKFKLTTDPMQPKEKPQSNSDGAPHVFTNPSLFEFNNDVGPAQSTAPLN